MVNLQGHDSNSVPRQHHRPGRALEPLIEQLAVSLAKLPYQLNRLIARIKPDAAGTRASGKPVPDLQHQTRLNPRARAALTNECMTAARCPNYTNG